MKTTIFKSLYFQVLTAITLGILLGHFYPDLGAEMKPLGDGFVKLIKMIIAPVIFCTVVTGIAGMESMKAVGRTGAIALLYFEIVSTIALIIGTVIVNLVQPGAGMNVDPGTLDAKAVAVYAEQAQQQGIIPFLLDIIPGSVIGAFASGNILQVLLFAVLFGFALHRLGEKGQLIFNVIDSFSRVIFGIINMIMRLAPLGAFGAMAFTIGKYGVGTTGATRPADRVLLHYLYPVRGGGVGQHRPRQRLQHLQIRQLHQRRTVDRAGDLVVRVRATAHAG